MTITDIQHGDNSIYATIDGVELEFLGGEMPSEGEGPCDKCGKRTEFDQRTEEWKHVMHGAYLESVKLCSECLK